MENKYKNFLENVEKLKIESNKGECETLIKLAQNFYSHYQQNNRLASVGRRLANIYRLIPIDESRGDWAIELKENQLDIISRVVLNFYKKIIIAKNKDKPLEASFYNWIRDYEDDVDDLASEFGLDERQIQGKSLKIWIEESCQKALSCYKKKKPINLGIDNIKKTSKLFEKCKELSVVPEEESFNNVFSEKYINMLIDVMNNNEALLCLYIAPIRAQLCDSEQGERDRDSTTWTWCYQKDMRISLSELKSHILKEKAYDEILCRFETMSIELDKHLKQIKIDRKNE